MVENCDANLFSRLSSQNVHGDYQVVDPGSRLSSSFSCKSTSNYTSPPSTVQYPGVGVWNIFWERGIMY